MRLRKWGSLSLLLVLLLSLTLSPAEAALIPVNPGQPTTISSKADAEKAARLQTYNQLASLSPISPDDQAFLAVTLVGTTLDFGFLNINDGSFTPIKFPARPLLPLVTPFWIDANNLVYLSVQGRDTVLVVANKQAGEIKTTKVTLPGFPVGFSPDGSKLLVLSLAKAATPKTEGFEEAVAVDPLKSPYDQKVRIRPSLNAGKPSWKDGLTAEERALLATFEQSDEFLQFASVPLALDAVDFNTGKLINVFTIPAGVSIPTITWSPDSSKLAMSRAFDVGRIGQYSGGQRLTNLVVQDALGQLPPEKNPLLQGNSIDTFDFATNTPNVGLIKATDNGGTDQVYAFSWSPDNQTLLVPALRPSRFQGRSYPSYLSPESSYIRFYEASGKLTKTLDIEEINTPPTVIGEYNPVFVSQNEVMINIAKGSSNRIYYYNLASGEFRQLPIPDGNSGLMLPTNNSRQVVFLHSSFVQAPEMFRINFDGANLTQLTRINDKITATNKVRADAVSFTLANGQKRTGYLLQAADAEFPPKNVPLVVWQEGGPTVVMLNQWAANVENPFELLPNFGFAVLFVPLSGRYGFGPDFYKGLYNNDNYGKLDIDEMAEIVKQTVDRGYTSPGKIGITGCSYGGYFTSQSITRYPDLYAAANSQCTLADLFTEAQFDQTALIALVTGRTPTTDPDFYVKASPLFNAKKVKTPTLFFHGSNDFIPIETIVTFHDQILANGGSVNLMGFNREGHGLASRSNQLIAAQAQVNWFRQYLGVSAPAPAISSGN